MVITISVEALDGSWIYCYTGFILARAPRTKETLLDFCENIDPDKQDTSINGTQQCGIGLPEIHKNSVG